MYKVSYSQEGLKGTLAEGFVKREAYLKELSGNLGATIEAVYWALGDDDAYVLVDGPSANVVAGSLAAAVGGVGKVSTVALFTAAEMDEAASKLPNYRAPGR
jgi:uncharacterized protein with GYD domain